MTAIGVLSVSFALYSKAVKSRFNSKIHFIGRNISNISSVYFLTNNAEQLSQLASTLMKDPDIGGIKIINNQGEKLASTGNIDGENYQKFEIVSSQSKFLTLFNPEQTQEILGSIYIYYSQTEIFNMMKRLLYYAVLISLLITFVMILISYRIIYMNLLKPLNDLINTTEEVGKGKMYTDLSSSNLPEIQKLLNSFINMVDSLKKSREELSETYDKLMKERAMAEMGKFSLLIAHEFKNPLSIIKSALNVLEKDNIDSQTKSQMLRYVYEEVARLDNLIKEFLVLNKPQNPNYEEVDLKELFSNLKDKIEFEYSNVSILWETKDFDKVTTDYFIMQKILFNLVKNSVEANATKIELISDFKTDHIWRLKLCDNGKGLTEEECNKMFEPFFSTKKTGTGLGLVMVERMIKVLNGEISVVKNSESGVTVNLTFEISG